MNHHPIKSKSFTHQESVGTIQATASYPATQVLAIWLPKHRIHYIICISVDSNDGVIDRYSGRFQSSMVGKRSGISGSARSTHYSTDTALAQGRAQSHYYHITTPTDTQTTW